MKRWRWFVGQVKRLRRSIIGVFAPGPEGPPGANEPFASTDETTARPPAHWVERVQRGAPGLLEPSLRRRREAAGPPAADSVARSQAEVERQPEPLDELERDDAPPEPRDGHQRTTAQASLWRKVLRRERSALAPAAAVEASPPSTEDHLSRELQAAMRSVRQSSRHDETRDGRSLAREAAPARPSSTAVGEHERSPRPSDVVELEAPALEQRTARVERAARPDRPTRADVAPPSEANVRQAELAVDRVGAERMWEGAAPSAPSRESNLERLREPAVPRPSPRQDPVAEPGPPLRGRAEPLSAVDRHPWPELPPPVDHADGDVEATLRAWEHQRRIDHEQTRL